jgi:hypothetical protein
MLHKLLYKLTTSLHYEVTLKYYYRDKTARAGVVLPALQDTYNLGSNFGFLFRVSSQVDIAVFTVILLFYRHTCNGNCKLSTSFSQLKNCLIFLDIVSPMGLKNRKIRFLTPNTITAAENEEC